MGTLLELADRCAEFGLEPENFRVDSSDWRVVSSPNGLLVKIDGLGEVTELLEGELAGEQLFTLDAALRETAKAGKRIPTRKDWNGIVRKIVPGAETARQWTNDALVRETLGLKLAGYRDSASGAHYYQGGYGNYWAAAPIKSDQYFGRFFAVSATQFHPVGKCFRMFGYSVRCLAE